MEILFNKLWRSLLAIKHRKLTLEGTKPYLLEKYFVLYYKSIYNINDY